MFPWVQKLAQWEGTLFPDYEFISTSASKDKETLFKPDILLVKKYRNRHPQLKELHSNPKDKADWSWYIVDFHVELKTRTFSTTMTYPILQGFSTNSAQTMWKELDRLPNMRPLNSPDSTAYLFSPSSCGEITCASFDGTSLRLLSPKLSTTAITRKSSQSSSFGIRV